MAEVGTRRWESETYTESVETDSLRIDSSSAQRFVPNIKLATEDRVTRNLFHAPRSSASLDLQERRLHVYRLTQHTLNTYCWIAFKLRVIQNRAHSLEKENPRTHILHYRLPILSPSSPNKLHGILLGRKSRVSASHFSLTGTAIAQDPTHCDLAVDTILVSRRQKL